MAASMRAELKALSRETVLYGVSAVVGRFLNFLLVPFYVNVLRSSAEYGTATSLYTWLGFINVVNTLGLEAAYFRYAARAEGAPDDPQRARRFFSTPFWVIVTAAGVLSIVLAAAAPVLTGPLFNDPKAEIFSTSALLARVIRWGALIVFLDAFSTLPFAELRLERKAFRFSLFRLSAIVTTLALNYVLIVGRGWGVEGIFVANAAGSGVACLLLLPTLLKRLEFRWDREVLKKFLPFGLTNVPAYVSSMMVQVIDRPIVQAILGLGALGVYQANYRLGFVMMVLVGLFEYAWRPFFMRQHLADDAKARVLFARVFTYVMTALGGAFLALSWGLPHLVAFSFWGRRLLTPEYAVGLPIVPVVMLAYVFQGMYTNFIAGVYIKEKNKALPWVSGLGAALNIAANLVLVPRWGLMGAAAATLVAYMAMAGALFAVSHRIYPVPYEWGRLRNLTLVVAGAFALERLAAFRWSGGELAAAQALLGAGAGAGLWAVFFTPGEKKVLINFVQSGKVPAVS
jgi:O-antigen/teichoic acid export membrane protein